MTNKEKQLRIEALESELLSNTTAENFPEMAETLLACDKLYYSYTGRCLSDNHFRELTPELTPEPEAEPEPETASELEQEITPDPDPEPAPATKAEPEQDDAPTRAYMVKVLSHAANAKGVDVGACITSLGYKKLSDMPREKYRELLKLAGCDE